MKKHVMIGPIRRLSQCHPPITSDLSLQLLNTFDRQELSAALSTKQLNTATQGDLVNFQEIFRSVRHPALRSSHSASLLLPRSPRNMNCRHITSLDAGPRPLSYVHDDGRARLNWTPLACTTAVYQFISRLIEDCVICCHCMWPHLTCLPQSPKRCSNNNCLLETCVLSCELTHSVIAKTIGRTIGDSDSFQ